MLLSVLGVASHSHLENTSSQQMFWSSGSNDLSVSSTMMVPELSAQELDWRYIHCASHDQSIFILTICDFL